MVTLCASDTFARNATNMGSGNTVHDRTDYGRTELTEEQAGNDPIALFATWLQEAQADGLSEPNAMALATAGALTISCRMVLLRAFDERGFVFHTNYNSRKALDLERDPRAALTFFWPQHERQVRIEGRATQISVEESDAYFATRPRTSRIGAWSSDQSRPVEDRKALDERYVRWTERFGDNEVPRPLHWGGHRVEPVRIEFWQGRSDRMHDRIAYERLSDGQWLRVRLQP